MHAEVLLRVQSKCRLQPSLAVYHAQSCALPACQAGWLAVIDLKIPRAPNPREDAWNSALLCGLFTSVHVHTVADHTLHGNVSEHFSLRMPSRS